MGDQSDTDAGGAAGEVVSADLQGGTVTVYEDRVGIERSKRSMHGDKTIPMDEIYDVEYSGGITTGHIQIRQTGMDHATGGFLSHPVDENTLYFPRNKRSDATALRDEILARASGSSSAEGGPNEER